MFAIRFAILSSLFYALNVSMVPMVYSFGVSAFLFLFFRFGTTFLLSLVVTKSLFSFTDIKEKGLVGWLILLTILFGIQSWLFVEAVKYIPVAIASIVLFTYPLITYLMQSHSKNKNLDLTFIFHFICSIKHFSIPPISHPKAQSNFQKVNKFKQKIFLISTFWA